MIHGQVGKLSWNTAILKLQMNETCLHDRRTRKKLTCWISFLLSSDNTDMRQLFSLAFILFEMSLNALSIDFY